MIGVLVFPDFQLQDAAGPISVFEVAASYAGVSPAIRILAVTPGAVRSSSGVEIFAEPHQAFSRNQHFDRGGRREDPELQRCAKPRCHLCGRWPNGASASPAFVPASYILAEAGLLDGRRATTHWWNTQDFVSSYPKVKLEPDQIYVRDGNIWSSWGHRWHRSGASDGSGEDYGEEVAKNTARRLVVYHRRSGGQSQFSSLLELKAPGGRFGPLLAWARASRCATDARRSGGAGWHEFEALHPRLSRRDWLYAVEGGRALAHRSGAPAGAQSSSEAIDRVAQLTGFRDPNWMRRAFIRAFGLPPQSLRRAARAS